VDLPVVIMLPSEVVMDRGQDSCARVAGDVKIRPDTNSRMIFFMRDLFSKIPAILPFPDE
jgi:hypothetical protein